MNDGRVDATAVMLLSEDTMVSYRMFVSRTPKLKTM